MGVNSVQEGEQTNSHDGALGLRRSSVLQKDGVGSSGHGPDVGVLKCSDPSISRESVQQSNFKKNTDIREQSLEVVKELGCKAIPKRPGVPHLAGHLTWSSAKAEKKCVSGSGIWGESWHANH